MNSIRDRMSRLDRGLGSIVLIRGGAGLGTSRVVAEAVTEAGAAGLQVSRCELRPPDQLRSGSSAWLGAGRLPERPTLLVLEHLHHADRSCSPSWSTCSVERLGTLCSSLLR